MLNNPLGVVIAAATLLFSLYKSLNKELSVNEQKQKALNDVNLTANKSIAEQTVKLERLLKIARNETKSKADRLAAIKQLNEISPEYLGNLSLEEIATNKATIALEKYRKNLLLTTMDRALNDKITKLQDEKIGLEDKSWSDIYDEHTNPVYKFLGGIANGFGATDVVDNLIGDALKKNKAAIDAIDAQITHLQKLAEENFTSIVEMGNENILDGGGGGGGDASGEKEKKLAEQKKRINDEKEKLDAAHLEAMAEIKKKVPCRRYSDRI
jgi:tubulin-specific chaperone A